MCRAETIVVHSKSLASGAPDATANPAADGPGRALRVHLTSLASGSSNFAAVSLCLFAMACGGQVDAPVAMTIDGLDPGFFACEVQPIFDRSCAFSNCHGDPGRPLFLYSMSKTRATGAEAIGEELTDLETCRNFYRAASFRTDPVELSQLITKPATLDTLGSLYHAGNYLFRADSQEAACIAAWLSGAHHEAGQVSDPPSECWLPWRATTGLEYPKCAPKALDCAQVVRGTVQ